MAKLIVLPEATDLIPAPDALPVICQELEPTPPKFQVLLLSTTPGFMVTTPLAAVVSTVMLLADSEAETARLELPAADAPPALLLIR